MDDEFDFLWEIIDSHQKFEIIAYLAVSCENPTSEWFLTPKTRDGQRDAEGHSISGINFFEAKFFEKDNHKLNLTRIGTNILIAVCNKANKIYIFSNGNLASNIIKFLEKHQHVESSEDKQTEILFYDRQQTSISILKHVDGELLIQNNEIRFINYRSLTKQQIEKYRIANKNIVEEAIEQIQKKKELNKDSFFFNPTVRNFNNIDCPKKKRIAIDNYFSFLLYFDENEAFDSIRITVGNSFFMYISISNYFNEKLICKISIHTANAKNKLEILNNWDTLNDCFIKEIEIEPLKSEIISLNSLFHDSDYDGINIDADIYSRGQLLFHKEKHIKEEIHLSNKFFFTHYFGNKNNLERCNVSDLFDRSYENRKYRVRIIKGAAGVGKSRLITEILNMTYHLNPKRDVLSCTMGQDNLISICKKILQLTTGIDYNSLRTIREQSNIEYNLNKTGQLQYIFKDETEFYYLCNEIDTLFYRLSDKPNEKTIKKTAELFGKLLLRFHRGTSVLIFEDVHRCTDIEFQFFLELDDYLRKYNGEKLTLMLFATRTQSDISINNVTGVLKGIEQNVTQSSYSYFELKLSERHNKEIISILTDLEPEESNAMIRDVFYEFTIDEPYIQKIISLCGNNPFGIIHTLIQLNSLRIISNNYENKYFLETINRIESDYKPHEQINYIFDIRFNSYKKNDNWIIIQEIIQILVIFKSQIEFTVLKEFILDEKSFPKAFNMLEEERIITYSNGIVKFEHENLFIYASNKQMEESQNIADKIFLFLKNKDEGQVYEEYKVRALFWGSFQYKDEFYKYAKSYFHFLHNKDLWRESIYYGNLILSKKEIPLNRVDVREIEMKILILQSECDDTLVALNMMKKLFIQVKQDLYFPQIKGDYDKYYNLFLEIWLQKSDIELHAGHIKEAQNNLNGLIYEIQENTTRIDSRRQCELYAWIYNRLGVIEMKNKDYTNCIDFLEKGLEYAKKINHFYYIHHNYYDLCIVNLLKGDTKYMNFFCKKAQMNFLKEDSYKNARVRTTLQVCLVDFIQERKLETTFKVRKTVENALFYSYFHEANRGLLYLSSMYLLLGHTNDCDEILIKGVKFAEIDKSVKILLGLYSGCIYRFYSQYINGRKEALKMALEYFKKALYLIATPQHLNISVNYWIGMVIKNLQIFEIALQQKITLQSFNNEETVMIYHLREYQVMIPENSSRFKIKAVEKGSLIPYYAIFS